MDTTADGADDIDGAAGATDAADGPHRSGAPPDAAGEVGALRESDETPGSRPGGARWAEPAAAAVPRAHAGAVDAAGMVVLACWGVWVLVCAAGREARPEGTLLALLAVTAGYAAGRVLGAMVATLTLAAGSVVVVLLVLVPGDRLAAGSAPPLGYHNADAALLVLATGAACCAAWGPGCATTLRAALWLVAAAAAVTALLLGSAAAFAAGTAVLLCSAAAARMRHRLLGLAGLAVAALIAVSANYAVAVDALPAGLSQSLAGQLTAPRVALWHEAVHLAGQHPLRGVGPERFAEESTPLPTDTPTAETPQSAPLQLAAEQGVPGAALLGAAYLWTLCALWRSPQPTPVVLTAGAALTGLGMLATVDHVLSCTAVTAAAGLLAGLATSCPLTPPARAGERP
jgi:O-antigen ligase